MPYQGRTGSWLNNFLMRVSGPLAHVFQGNTEQGRMAPIFFYTAAANRQITTLMQVEGTARDLARQLVRQLATHTTTGFKAGAVADLIEDRMTVLQAEAMAARAPLDDAQRLPVAISIADSDFERLARGLALHDGATEAEKKAVRDFFNKVTKYVPLEVQDAIQARDYKALARLLNTPGIVPASTLEEAAKGASRGKREFIRQNFRIVRGGAVAGTFQGLLTWASMATAYKALDKALRLGEGQFDAWGRMGAAVVSAIYTISGAVSAIMQNVHRVRVMCLRVSTKLTHTAVSAFSKRMFKGAAWITAAMDLIKGVEKGLNGKIFEGVLLGLSGIASIMSTLTYFAKGTPMVLLFLASVGIVAVITIVKDDDFQEWLSKCCFGYGYGDDKKHYASLETERLALEEAAK